MNSEDEKLLVEYVRELGRTRGKLDHLISEIENYINRKETGIVLTENEFLGRLQMIYNPRK